LNTALIVSSSIKATEYFKAFVQEHFLADITLSANGNDARRLLDYRDFDILIINTPLSDEFGTDLAVISAEKTSSGIVVAVKNELLEDISPQMEDSGIITIAKPIHRSFLYQSIKLAYATHTRVIGFQNTNQRLEQKIQEIKLVDRAKCLLIEHENMPEKDAHRWIEKKAMDERKSKKDIAMTIISYYELQ